MAGRKLTPRPEPTICTRVGREVAAKGPSSVLARGAFRPQAARACSRRQWPSSSRIISSRSSSSGGVALICARGWLAGRAATSSSSVTWARSRPVVSYGRAIRAASSWPALRPAISRWVRSSRRNRRRLGYCVRSRGKTRGSRKGATVGITPRRKRPARGWPAWRASCTISSASLRMVAARRRAASPTAVRITPVRARSTTGAPRVRSSSWMPAERVGWVTWAASAARPKAPCSAKALRYCSWRTVGRIMPAI